MKFSHLLAGGVLLLAAAGASAQAFPTKPVTVVVPFVPGGSSDTTMRAMSVKLGELLGQPVILDNKPGANGTIGAGIVTRAPADGHTLLIGSVGTYAITPQLLKNSNFDPRNLDLLSIPVRTPNVVVVTPSFPANTVSELVDYMKKNPGKVSFGSSGVGSTDHLTTLLLWQKTGTEGVHVAYKGGGAAISDVMAGHANVLITNLGVLTNQIRAGKLKALAVTSARRVNELPDVPTMAEAGVQGLEIYSWQGISAPKGLPAPVRDKLATALASTLKDPQVRKTLETAGYDVVALPPAQAASELQSELVRWKQVIDASGVKAE